jgi:alkanesulfonate monooxygenase SsuD/methylene tetrahydromethanopterin reductase-like flavin-dependent oxidoreductase (luciferase family)
MHVLGARYAARVAGLVYVDAAFDRGDDADSEAFQALRAHLEKYGGAGPEAHLRARWTANPDGTVKGMYAPERAILQAMVREMRAAFQKPYHPQRIREQVEKLYRLTRERVRNHEKWFAAFAEQGRAVELSGTHHLLISNPREVVEQIDAFLSHLVDKR